MFMRLIRHIQTKLTRHRPEPIPDPQDQTLPDVRPLSVDLLVPGIKGTGPNPSFALPYGAETPLEALLRHGEKLDRIHQGLRDEFAAAEVAALERRGKYLDRPHDHVGPLVDDRVLLLSETAVEILFPSRDWAQEYDKWTRPRAYIALPEGALPQSITWRVGLHFAWETRRIVWLELRGNVVLGRSEQADLDLREFDDVSRGVSRCHAMLTPQPDRLTVTDLSSTNGTFVNGIRLSPLVPRELRYGDVVSLANLLFVVTISEQPPVH